MHVAFDALMLSLLFHPTAKPPKPIPDLPKRIRLLINELEEAGAKIIIPTPVLSEFLVSVGPVDGAGYLSELTTTDVFDIQPFDVRASIEAAEMHRKAEAAGDKKAGSEHRWQVVKVDRQFLAVAKVNGASVVYSNDRGVRAMAASVGMKCKGIEDLPEPPVDPQTSFFDTPAMDASPSSEPEPPSAQSPDGGLRKVTEPEQRRRAIRLADQVLLPPDSSGKAPSS